MSERGVAAKFDSQEQGQTVPLGHLVVVSEAAVGPEVAAAEKAWIM